MPLRLSGPDHVLLILHIGFAIFTLGPLTAVTMSTPRYLRSGQVAVARYLRRTTQIYAFGSIGAFLFGLFLAKGNFDKLWLAASMTLFIVALVLLLIVEGDQRKALKALEALAAPAPAPAPAEAAETSDAPDKAAEAPPLPPVSEVPADRAAEVTAVQRGRIASLSGVIALIWIVILVLMVWH